MRHWLCSSMAQLEEACCKYFDASDVEDDFQKETKEILRIGNSLELEIFYTAGGFQFK